MAVKFISEVYLNWIKGNIIGIKIFASQAFYFLLSSFERLAYV